MAARAPKDPPKRIHLRCKVDECGFLADAEDDNLQQYADLVLHFQTHTPEGKSVDKKNLGTGHDGLVGHPTPTSPSVLEAIWAEMDLYTAEAIEWPALPVSTDPWESDREREIAAVRHDLRKAQTVSAGKGIAIALAKMEYRRFPGGPDEVIQEAVRRYQKNRADQAA